MAGWSMIICSPSKEQRFAFNGLISHLLGLLSGLRKATPKGRSRFKVLMEKPGVYISKGGYHAVKGGRGSFEFADFSRANFHQPDPHAPVLFYLRKQGMTEVLKMGRISTKIPADGTPVRFDLLKMGTDSQDGQLEIAAVTNTEKYPPQRYDWWASVSVPDGGLVEHNEEFPFEAPLEGYQTRVEFDMPVTSPEWKPMVKRTYFVKFGSPVKYGRIHVDLDGRSQTIFVTYWVNPSGSRNLEVGPGVPQPVP
jgi:hypothetical protein